MEMVYFPNLQEKRMSPEIERSKILDEKFIQAVNQQQFPKLSCALSLSQVGLDNAAFLSLLDSQIKSRLLDIKARELKQQQRSFYTIGSSGHEGNAALGLAFRHTDMAFLHYRSGAFMLQRAKAKPEMNMVRDILYSLMAAVDDPIASGRHKVFGSLPLFVPPQTSTIASHLPKAVGAAASIKRAHMLNIPAKLPQDSVVLCSFGDASLHHSTALGAMNAAQWMAYSHLPLPIIFICEDNGWGISVPTPADWIETKMANQAGIEYLQADGLNLLAVYQVAKQAEHIARVQRKPVFLHLKMIRLLGHAGSDVETQYRDLVAIEQDEANDPLLQSAKIAIEQGVCDADEIIKLYQTAKAEIDEQVEAIAQAASLNSAKAVMASIIPPKLNQPLPAMPTSKQRQLVFKDKFAKLSGPLNLNQSINAALTDILLQHKNTLVFGEDVARKGGVYRVTADLQSQFGSARVFDSILDEQSILGYAIGHAHNGFIPIPEIQFLAYLHNAQDQLRGEAATLSFFSNGQYTNPMVLRIPSFAYQKGFGGHFHNDNSIAMLRDIPGIIIACPSRGDEAAKMLRQAVYLAAQEQRIVLFLEPIALYMTRDLLQAGDNEWLFAYPKPSQRLALDDIGIYGESDECVIVSYGNGHYLSQQAARDLKQQHGIDVKIIDLRWLAPLPEKALLNAVQSAKRILIVDECRRTGSLSEQLVSLLVRHQHPLPTIRVLAAEDSFITLGGSWQYLLPSREGIVRAVGDMIAII